MKIIHTDKPAFTHEGKKYFCHTKMFKSFSQFDEFLVEQEEKYGTNTCYFYNVSNIDGNGKLIINLHDNQPILFFRYRFIPKEPLLDKPNQMEALNEFLIKVSNAERVGIKRKILAIRKFIEELSKPKES